MDDQQPSFSNKEGSTTIPYGSTLQATGNGSALHPKGWRYSLFSYPKGREGYNPDIRVASYIKY